VDAVFPEQSFAEKAMSSGGEGFESTGRSSPLGASVVPGGVNFSVFSRGASAVELLLFDREDDARPARVIPIDSATNRSYHYLHIFVPGMQPGQLYGYRVHGQAAHFPLFWHIRQSGSGTKKLPA
jgi:pullulanase/glycogen debranching enzyme